MANPANPEAAQTQDIGPLKYSLGVWEKDVLKQLEEFAAADVMKKIWRKDSSVWTGADEGQWLGWLDIVEQQLAQVKLFRGVADDVRAGGFTQALLLGMGGSSLCVEVLRLTFGVRADYPDMHILDSTVPAQVSATLKQLSLPKTLVIVASKSGGTTEPNVLCQYFWNEMKQAVGEQVGEHFVAITDPGSSMEETAKRLKFRTIYYGVPSIGGRFSALSNFGMVPSAVMGLDVTAILAEAAKMVQACGSSHAPKDNPGAVLGSIMGVLSASGCDKVTIITSPLASSLGAWLEQLLAESTGKEGKGLIPVAAENLSEPNFYGKDRLFIYVRLSTAPDIRQDAAVDALEASGYPVVRIEMKDILGLSAEFFRFEFATAVTGAVLGINAFNQPNVQESKDYTKKYLTEYQETGKLPENTLLYEEDGIKLYADESNREILEKSVNGKKSLEAYLSAHLTRLSSGDYFAINAYLEREKSIETKLEELRTMVMKKHRVATTLGFGPRFLHSTGQLHKGGPNSGLFVQVTSDDGQDVEVPGEKFTFGILKQAQSLGDFLALSKRHRRLLRVHLPADVECGFVRLEKCFRSVIDRQI